MWICVLSFTIERQSWEDNVVLRSIQIHSMKLNVIWILIKCNKRNLPSVMSYIDWRSRIKHSICSLNRFNLGKILSHDSRLLSFGCGGVANWQISSPITIFILIRWSMFPADDIDDDDWTEWTLDIGHRSGYGVCGGPNVTINNKT